MKDGASFQNGNLLLYYNAAVLTNLQVSGAFFLGLCFGFCRFGWPLCVAIGKLAGLITGNTITINSIVTMKSPQDTSLDQKSWIT